MYIIPIATTQVLKYWSCAQIVEGFDMNKTKRNTMIIGSVVLALVVGAGVYGIGVATAGEVHIAEPRSDVFYSSYIVDGILDENRVITVNSGESIQLPVDIYAELDKTTAVNFGVVTDGWETAFALMGESNLPDGIHASTGQSSFSFDASEQTGIDKRGSTTVTITVNADTQPGKYPMSLVLHELRDGTADLSIEYFTLIVE